MNKYFRNYNNDDIVCVKCGHRLEKGETKCSFCYHVRGSMFCQNIDYVVYGDYENKQCKPKKINPYYYQQK